MLAPASTGARARGGQLRAAGSDGHTPYAEGASVRRRGRRAGILPAKKGATEQYPAQFNAALDATPTGASAYGAAYRNHPSPHALKGRRPTRLSQTIADGDVLPARRAARGRDARREREAPLTNRGSCRRRGTTIRTSSRGGGGHGRRAKRRGRDFFWRFLREHANFTLSPAASVPSRVAGISCANYSWLSSRRFSKNVAPTTRRRVRERRARVAPVAGDGAHSRLAPASSPNPHHEFQREHGRARGSSSCRRPLELERVRRPPRGDAPAERRSKRATRLGPDGCSRRTTPREARSSARNMRAAARAARGPSPHAPRSTDSKRVEPATEALRMASHSASPPASPTNAFRRSESVRSETFLRSARANASAPSSPTALSARSSSRSTLRLSRSLASARGAAAPDGVRAGPEQSRRRVAQPRGDNARGWQSSPFCGSDRRRASPRREHRASAPASAAMPNALGSYPTPAPFPRIVT